MTGFDAGERTDGSSERTTCTTAAADGGIDEYDLVVLGGGSGSQVATAAVDEGHTAAVVEPGPLGGACVTRGCIPSKALIHRADIVDELHRAAEFGVHADLQEIEFGEFTAAIHDTVYEKADNQESSLDDTDGLTRYHGTGRFVDDRTIVVESDDENASQSDSSTPSQIRGDTIIIAVGGRPVIPPIGGVEDVDYLTSEDALFLDEQPDSLVIVGGGYIGAELGYFFGALGTEVSLVGRSEQLVPREDDDVSEVVTDALESHCELYTGYEAAAVEETDDGIVVTAEPSDDGGSGDEGDDSGENDNEENSDESVELEAERLLFATGRRPNTDSLDLEKTGVETDDSGHIEVDEQLATTADDIWALGDVLANEPYKHAADYETRIVTANVLDDAGEEVDYHAMPHAIFTSPQVASVGQTEGALEERGLEYQSANIPFGTAPLGMILDADGFVKVLASPEGEILGCHIVGPHASTLIQEVVTAMDSGSGMVEDVAEPVHVHPALSEVVYAAFDELSSREYSTAPDWRDVSGA
ncbi:dihydrolipoyl dehydrogenase [Natrialba magadii ATCC 43099]|uniref:Dihydrolipoamide dehydrogenase n=1 Tax=Natrialba magadii (strain ATCC 43099 / DSM 3394 / CCM 3739 / CIP 104546 / IAM 13178 / JCM 8861 / NBRC 102185 / NCIMB 2190 / MS3) TaxID=547559 RepID=D3SUX0_NATMM|nr:dihydrolipoyl dehydrogenase [Natrialba magadii]ADD05378.1 dihydrolipoyl dehydrogenase [Natrialba magadii ATCC 43099]ELY29306.1 dihydrolipoamide dehydrogenase [Natrialba magadii ATCC 43099]